MHPQGRRDGSRVDADVPASQQAVGLARQLDQRIVPVAPVGAALPLAGLHRLVMVADVVADLQQQGDGELADRLGAVHRHVGNGDALFLCVGHVHHVVAGGQHGDEAHGGAGVDGPAGDGGLVGEDHLRVGDAGDDLLLVRQAGAVIHRQLAQLLQLPPAQVPGVLRIAVQNHDLHGLFLLTWLSPGRIGPGDGVGLCLSTSAADPWRRRTFRPVPGTPSRWRG